MELSAGVLVGLAVVVAGVALALGHYWRHREDSPPTPGPVTPSPASRFAIPAGRESQAFITWLISRAVEQTGVKVADDPMARQRIVEAAEKALKDLRNQTSVTISLPFITADAHGPKHFEIRVTRDTLKELAARPASAAGEPR